LKSWLAWLSYVSQPLSIREANSEGLSPLLGYHMISCFVGMTAGFGMERKRERVEKKLEKKKKEVESWHGFEKWI